MEEETFASWEAFFEYLGAWSRPSRSKGKSHNCFVKSTGCQAQLAVSVVWDATRSFHVKITQQKTAHNHSLGAGAYGNHPANRCVDDDAVIDFVNELQAAGAKKKRILQFMRKKTGKHVILREARNLVAKLKEARLGSTTVESRLEAGVRGFCSRKG
ncbi:hypothetical protein JG688_00015379 [Phytophthora aleatoria]|uniref:FAR1 domain-containing protein n=1 Tax=Phytophthora aleatoria TaxID=2496075 RepID=A0A8J5I5K8_9STRA|nr:hypothetical protein JG688_00015379 [Phytophthora aleatoria]